MRMPMTPSGTSYSAVVHSPPDTVDDAHDFLERVWAERGDVSVPERMVMETVLSELVTNVIQNNPHRPVFCEVELTITADELRLETTDTGDPLGGPPEPRMPGEEAESGRGLALIELMVDELTYRHDAAGNVWSARKVRGRPQAG